MRAYLLHQDRNFDFKADVRANAAALTQDLELETLFNAMAGDDEFLDDIVRRVLLTAGQTTVAEVHYRQDVFMDCEVCAPVVKELYALTIETLEKEKKIHLGIFRDSPEAVLNRSVEALTMFVAMLKRLRALADKYSGSFRSEAFKAMFATLKSELSDEYFATIEGHLRRMKFNGGVLISAALGDGNKGTNYVLRAPPPVPSWSRQLLDWMFKEKPDSYTFQLHPRDEAGAQALGRLRDRGLALAAQAVAESASHVLNFFRALRAELAFYIGCLNLHDRLQEIGCKYCMADPRPMEEYRFSCQELYDVCLALQMKKAISGNTISAANKHLAVITGANQGGKSTFLRSAGLAQLMMQSGMFVTAHAFSANLVPGIYTHYKREEDASMSSGKFDEELKRMSQLVDLIEPRSLVLFNESFASTNEREGSEIARQIVDALLEDNAKVMFVTHMFELAEGLRKTSRVPTLFLRAERDETGVRSFRLVEGEPLATSYGEDLYNQIFDDVPERLAAKDIMARPTV